MLIPLLSGAYTARSLSANAQRSVNLYLEVNPTETSPATPTTHYPTPGKILVGTPPVLGAGRCIYTDTAEQLYSVVNGNVYKVSNIWQYTPIGTITPGTTPVYISDNEVTCFLVDGTPNGYTWDVGTGANFAAVTDPNFYGSTRVDFLNTYFLFNKPGTPQFYTTQSGSTVFNPLYFANLTGMPTDLVGVAALHGVVWLVGKISSEIWFDSGDSNILPFQRMPDAVLHQGCDAKYSIAVQNGFDDSQTAVFWLSRTRDGEHIVLMGQGYAVKRVSNNAIEDQISKYQIVEDAIGYCYQQDGHSFYVLNFPTADVTWVYDTATNQWHQRTWLDSNGVSHRDRVQFAINAYPAQIDGILGIDWESGKLYNMSLNAFTDNGDPVQRIRAFPHLNNGMNRIEYARFVADIDAGTDLGTIDGTTPENPPMISLRWSDDRGNTWGNPVMRSIGAAGQFNVSPLWTQLGMARDRVFELSWSIPAKISLNGAYVEPIPLAT